MNRSKRLNTLRHLKVAFSEQVHLVQPTIFFFLLLDVLPDGSFIPAYRRNIVASCPELLTPEVSPSGPEIPGDVDCTLPLHIPRHVRNGILWGDGNQHMHMIRPQIAFLHPTLSLTHQLSKYLSQILAKLPIQHFPPKFRNPYQRILALPDRMAYTLNVVQDSLSFS